MNNSFRQELEGYDGVLYSIVTPALMVRIFHLKTRWCMKSSVCSLHCLKIADASFLADIGLEYSHH